MFTIVCFFFVVSNQAPQNAARAGGGLRVTNPADLRRNGDVRNQQPVITKAPTPRRHTVTVGGMDLEMGEKANTVHDCFIQPKF